MNGSISLEKWIQVEENSTCEVLGKQLDFAEEIYFKFMAEGSFRRSIYRFYINFSGLEKSSVQCIAGVYTTNKSLW